MRRRAYLATVASTGVALAGCLGANGSATEYDVGMSSTHFLPETFAVTPGTTVVWKNTSSHAHTVTAYDDGIPAGTEYFASGDYEDEQAARDAWKRKSGGAVHAGDVYEHTFEQPGTYAYVCIPHEVNGMVGAIEVTEDATRTPQD